MRRLMLAALAALLLIAPAASAHHWDRDWTDTDDNFGDSDCNYFDAECDVQYACTGGAPPQVVDLVLYCALRASGEVVDIATSVPRFGWAWLDFASYTAEGAVGGTLCDQVWSGWCTIADPVGAYPL